MTKNEWIAQTCVRLKRYDTEHIEACSKVYDFMCNTTITDEVLETFITNFKEEEGVQNVKSKCK